MKLTVGKRIQRRKNARNNTAAKHKDSSKVTNQEVLGGRKHQSRKMNSGDVQTRKRKRKNQASNCDTGTEEAQLQQRTRALSCTRTGNLPKIGSRTSDLDGENHKCTEKKNE
jgi:hypothetical protein